MTDHPEIPIFVKKYAAEGFPTSIALRIDELRIHGLNDENRQELLVLMALADKKIEGFRKERRFYGSKESADMERDSVSRLANEWHIVSEEADVATLSRIHAILHNPNNKPDFVLEYQESQKRAAEVVKLRERLKRLEEESEAIARERLDVLEEIKKMEEARHALDQ